MIPLESRVQGTIQPDGTLVLDEPTTLPPGRVDVIVRQAFEPPVDRDPSRSDWRIGLEEIRRNQAARGYVPRTREEVDAELHEIRYGCSRGNVGAAPAAGDGPNGGDGSR